MISSLSGTVGRVAPGKLVLDVGGVGYGVQVIPQLAASHSVGDPLTLEIVTVVREDSISLYGFDDLVASQIFEALMGVTGVGPRSAMAVLAHLTPTQIRQAVTHEDDAAFTRVTGIGPKTAKLICVQLAGKLGDTAEADGSAGEPSTQRADLVSALVGLGWNERAATRALQDIDTTHKSAAEILREALNSLGGQG